MWKINVKMLQGCPIWNPDSTIFWCGGKLRFFLILPWTDHPGHIFHHPQTIPTEDFLVLKFQIFKIQVPAKLWPLVMVAPTHPPPESGFPLSPSSSSSTVPLSPSVWFHWHHHRHHHHCHHHHCHHNHHQQDQIGGWWPTLITSVGFPSHHVAPVVQSVFIWQVFFFKYFSTMLQPPY